MHFVNIQRETPIGRKFIFGFLIVILTVVLIPHLVNLLEYSTLWSELLSYIITITVGLVLGTIFSRSFTANFKRLTSSTEAICQGDLTRNVDIKPTLLPDETHDLARSLNIMLESLRDLVSRIRDTAGQVTESAKTLSASSLEVNASTEEVAQAMEQISKGAETQAEMVEKSSKAIREMAISIELVAGKAREAAKAARETSDTARRGEEMSLDSLEKTRHILDLFEQGGHSFLKFNTSLQRVSKIADVINDIARQTNLLALNASIEAARAGEFGKGFAVVADEVRKLADGSSKSAAEIIEVITAVKDDSQKVHDSITETFRRISDGRKNMDITASAFQEIRETVQDTERKANSIADLSQMQTEGAERMVKAVDEISKVAEDNAAATEQVSAATEEQSAAMQEMTHAAQELAKMAEELLQAVVRFRLGQDEQLTP
ncbi:MAG TPA: methyl-accepting chemotaxis protein [Geobacterales bacterium]|nr:methyl-accepting chemotaxis protein [Geobacterales bacterium]